MNHDRIGHAGCNSIAVTTVVVLLALSVLSLLLIGAHSEDRKRQQASADHVAQTMKLAISAEHQVWSSDKQFSESMARLAGLEPELESLLAESSLVKKELKVRNGQQSVSIDFSAYSYGHDTHARAQLRSGRLISVACGGMGAGCPSSLKSLVE